MAITDRADEIIGAPWGVHKVNREYENTRSLQFQLGSAIIPSGGGTSTCTCTGYASPLATLVDPSADFTRLVAGASAEPGDGLAHSIWIRDENAANGAFTGYGRFSVRIVDSPTQIRVYDPNGYLASVGAVAYTAVYDLDHAAKIGHLHDGMNSHAASLMARPVVSNSPVLFTQVYQVSLGSPVADHLIDLSGSLGPLPAPRWGAFRVTVDQFSGTVSGVSVELKTAVSGGFARGFTWGPNYTFTTFDRWNDTVLMPLEGPVIYAGAAAVGSGPGARVTIDVYGFGA